MPKNYKIIRIGFSVIMLLVRLFSVTFLMYSRSGKADIRLGSGIPLPHATELENMIRNNIFSDKNDNETYMEYFEQYNMHIDKDTLIALQNLDFSVLDLDAVRNILRLEKIRENRKTVIETRRKVVRNNWESSAAFADRRATQTVNKTIDLMRQSIYSTRYMIEKTKPIRKMYRTELVYQMGILYGFMLELRFKADNCFATMGKFDTKNYKFARFLWLYERLLSIYVDFTDSLERMFLLQVELHKPTTPIVTTTESSEETT